MADEFTAEEKAAMKERAKEARASRGKRSKADGEKDVLEKIEAMAPADRAIAEALHALVKEITPDLAPKTWYGMPAYARDGKVVVFFQDAGKFKYRYSTIGFQDAAHLDDGDMWPASYAVLAWTDEVRDRVAELLRAA